MRTRAILRRLGLAGLVGVLIGWTPSGGQGEPPAAGEPGGGLAVCAVSAGPPGTTPRPVAEATCRARPTQTLADAGLPVPAPGYHHLGATSVGTWSGVLGRVTVRDPAVRRGSHDFVATRFMAKREADGKVSWLEAGWAETGWAGDGRQRIYTYDTKRSAWTFYDEYRIADGDQVWLYLHTASTTARTLWQAWLWWGDGWHLLTAQELPLGGKAQVEQYLEVHVDPRQSGDGLAVPRIGVDNVQVKAAPNGELRYWREAEVPTAPGGGTAAYCLEWVTRYDTWSAGDCPAAPLTPPAGT